MSLFKTMFYFIRAYQDSIYGIILLITGNQAGKYASASKLSKPEHHIRKLIDENIKDYYKWFDMWRSKRNAIKEGQSFGITGPGEDVSINFNVYDPKKNSISVHLENNIKIKDID